MFFIRFFIALLLFASAQSESIELGLDGYILEVYDTDENCSSQTWEIKIDEESGSGLLINIDYLNLNSDNDSYLLISTDESMQGVKSSVAYLSGNIENKTLAIPMTQTAFIQLQTNESCYEDLNFYLNLTVYDKLVPVRPPTSPEPCPVKGCPKIQVYFSRTNISDFSLPYVQKALKQGLKEAALRFCIENRINCIIKPEDETVFITEGRQCPEEFADYETCVAAKLAISINARYEEYELTIAHLLDLWQWIEENGIPGNHIKAYKFDSPAIEILWWVLWVVIALIVASIAFVAFYVIEKMAIATKKQEEEERQLERKDILSKVELRKKGPTLHLSMHQKMPQFMLDSADTASVVSTPPPTTKIHFLKPIMKQISSETSPVLPTPNTQDWVSGLVIRGLQEDDDDEDVILDVHRSNK